MARFSRPELIKTVSKLEGLTADLAEILYGIKPDAYRLEHAPTLDQWRIAPAPFPVLVGNVVGHPKLLEGEVVTSQLFLLDEELRWARTFSRYYKLGQFKSGNHD